MSEIIGILWLLLVACWTVFALLASGIVLFFLSLPIVSGMQWARNHLRELGTKFRD